MVEHEEYRFIISSDASDATPKRYILDAQIQIIQYLRRGHRTRDSSPTTNIVTTNHQ